MIKNIRILNLDFKYNEAIPIKNNCYVIDCDCLFVLKVPNSNIKPKHVKIGDTLSFGTLEQVESEEFDLEESVANSFISLGWAELN